MDFSLAIEELKSNPLTSNEECYETVRRELMRKDGKNKCPQVWAWLAQVQEVSTDVKPSEIAIQAATIAANHLVKNKKSLNVDIDIIAKLLMNILLKLLTICPVGLCGDLYEIVSKVKLKPSKTATCMMLNLQICNVKINGSFDEHAFYENWLQLSKEETAKSDYFLSLLLHTWLNSPHVGQHVCQHVWRLFRRVFDENTFIEKVVDKFVPKLMLRSEEPMYLLQCETTERIALRIVCHCTSNAFEGLFDVEYNDLAHLIITINKAIRGEDICPVSYVVLKGTSAMKEEICIWLYRVYPSLKMKPHILKLILHLVPLINDPLLLCQLAKIAFENQHFPLCLQFLSQASGPEVSKLLYGMGGALVKRELIGEATLFFDLLINDEHLTLKQLETIASAYARAQLYDKSRSVLAVAIRREPSLSLIERFCSLPVSQIDWSDRELMEKVLPVTISSGKCHPSLISAILESKDDYVLPYKHQYYLKNYRSAPLEQLLDDCKDLPSVYKSIWSFALGQDPQYATGEDTLVLQYNQLCMVFEEAFSPLASTPISNRLQLIGELHQSLSDSESQLRNTPRSNRTFISDSVITLRIVSHLIRLSYAYKQVGVWKPTRAYLSQAMELCKSLWPKREELWRGIEGALYDLDIIAMGTSELHPYANKITQWISSTDFGLIYYPVNSSIVYSPLSDNGLALTYEAYKNLSPHEFTQTVNTSLVNRSLPIVEALGLIALSSSLPFDLRDRVERKAFTEPIPLVSDWSEHLCKLASSFMSDPVLAFIFDEVGKNLIMANYQTQKILVIPAATLPTLVKSLVDLLDENKRMLFKKKDQSVAETSEFKRTWWKVRQSLDLSLGKIAAQMDTALLFLFKALFDTNVGVDKIERMKAALAETFPGTESAAETLLLYGPIPKASVLESLLPLLSISVENKAKTIKELRRCFEKAFIDEDVFSDAPIAASIPTEILLVLDKNLHLLPWEVTPTLKNIRVYRQASFWHLQRQAASRLKDDPVSYILNPGGDLRQTEAFFSERLRPQWRGIIGRPPQEQEFLESLSSSNLFMYFGHGGGDAYVKGSHIRSLPQVAPSFLIGCSSGRIKTLGPFCPEGTFLNYLYAGCPTILVNLWDVTDKDIDKFTDCMLTRLNLYQDSGKDNDENVDNVEGGNLGEAVDDARQVCFLRHLNGAAPVIYGLPFV